MKTVLVTGGAGFIGSCFVRQQVEAGEYNIVNLDALTYAGNLENLKAVSKSPRYHFVKGDIADRKLLKTIFHDDHIEAVVNFAAESHVDRSIEDPEIFLRTNVLGTLALLDTAKQYWKQDPGDKYSCEYKEGVRFLQVSTDEVYGALGPTGQFTETSPLSPNSPYSASKASADMFVHSYCKTFGLPTLITRSSNNYGPYQFPEKLIPLMIYNCMRGQSLPVYGDGMQVRDWLHVSDHCTGIAAVLQKGTPGQIYNIGGNNEKANIEIVRQILKTLGKGEDLISYVKDRPGHDRRYAIDNAKITSTMGWRPRYTFEQGLEETIRWYVDHPEWIQGVVSGAYQGYYEKFYGNL